MQPVCTWVCDVYDRCAMPVQQEPVHQGCCPRTDHHHYCCHLHRICCDIPSQRKQGAVSSRFSISYIRSRKQIHMRKCLLMAKDLLAAIVKSEIVSYPDVWNTIL